MCDAAKQEYTATLNRKKAISLCHTHSNIKLEIGSGPRKGVKGWTTLDLSDGSDLNWDLTVGLPFPDSTLAEIYTSHTLEHFSRDQIVKLLQECYRCLQNNGSIRVCVPDASIYINAYTESPDKFKPIDVFEPAYVIDTPIDYINYTAYMCGHHHHMFDKENLINLLRKAGFGNASISNYDERYDIAIRDWESIYAVAVKQ